MTADELRLRLRAALDAKRISQSELVRRLSAASGEEWLIAHVGRLLNGHIRLRVEDLLLIAEVAELSLVDLVREPGREFVADLTPTELRMIHAMRDHPSIVGPLSEIVRRLTPEGRRPQRAVLRERMRRARERDE